MNISNYIESLDLQIEETYRVDCPLCNGNNTFTATKTHENILYNCYKAGCSIQGYSSYRYTVKDALNKNKKLHFTPETLKTFGNVLVHMVGTFNSNFKEELQNKMTKPDEKVNLK